MSRIPNTNSKRPPNTNKVSRRGLDIERGTQEARAFKQAAEYDKAWAAVDAYKLPASVVTSLGLPPRKRTVR